MERKAEPRTFWKISGNVGNGKCAGMMNLFRLLKSVVTHMVPSGFAEVTIGWAQSPLLAFSQIPWLSRRWTASATFSWMAY